MMRNVNINELIELNTNEKRSGESNDNPKDSYLNTCRAE